MIIPGVISSHRFYPADLIYDDAGPASLTMVIGENNAPES